MTPSSDMVEAGQRLASDLRRIRELRGVSIESFLERTKASPDIITAFEQNALVDHPLYNRVYLRSFVRMYAEAVDIDPDAALAAAEQLLEGRYDGSLATRYLEGGPAAKGEDEAAGEGEPAATPVLPAESAALDTAAEPTPAEVPEPAPPQDDVTTGPPATAKPAEAPVESPPSGPAPPAKPAETPPAAAPPPAASGTLPPPAPTGTWTGHLKWIIPGVLALVIAAILIFGRSEPEVREAPVVPVEPTPIEPLPPAPVDTTDSIQVRMPPRVVLPDSISVWVVAERDTLNPIRVRTDDDIRRPYWIEIGDSTEFRIKDRIALERETGAIALYVAGYRLPLDRVVPGEPIELDRERIQAILDSLRMVQ
jgi:hypothetical protein